MIVYILVLNRAKNVLTHIKGIDMQTKKCGLVFLLFGNLVFAMENTQVSKYHSVIMPGQNGLGGGTFHLYNIVNTRTFTRFDTNYSKIDFGQEHCIAHFEKQLANDADAKNKKLLLYGVSQGSATVVNWLAQFNHEEQEQKVACVVLEAVLGTGNSAINHTVGTFMPSVTYIPTHKLWLPWVAKLAFPYYKPHGIQALKSAKKLSPHIPVVIMHCKNDFQLSINDARKLYCVLRNQGNEAYLFETNSGRPQHLELFAYDRQRDQKIRALQAIYKKHNLPYENIEGAAVNISYFQPSIEEVEARIAQSE